MARIEVVDDPSDQYRDHVEQLYCQALCVVLVDLAPVAIATGWQGAWNVLEARYAGLPQRGALSWSLLFVPNGEVYAAAQMSRAIWEATAEDARALRLYVAMFVNLRSAESRD